MSSAPPPTINLGPDADRVFRAGPVQVRIFRSGSWFPWRRWVAVATDARTQSIFATEAATPALVLRLISTELTRQHQARNAPTADASTATLPATDRPMQGDRP